MDGGWVRERGRDQKLGKPRILMAQDLEQMCAKVRDKFGGGLSRYLGDCEGIETGRGRQ